MASGSITTIAGNGRQSDFGGGPALNAQLLSPLAVTVDNAGNIFIADAGNARVREIPNDNSGTIQGVANQVGEPDGLTVDTHGDLFIADFQGDSVRRSFAGLLGSIGGTIKRPGAVAADSAGNLYVASDLNSSILKITPDGTTSVFAGGGGSGYSGDGGPASQAQFRQPQGLAIDLRGNVFVADTGNNAIREIGIDGNVTTVGGTGYADSDGDGA